MAKTKNKPRQREALADPFSELQARSRTAESEELLVHDVGEAITDNGLVFDVEARVIVHLEDGRTLNKVFDLQFDEDDL